MDISVEDIKTSIWHIKKVTRKMYVYDIQFKLWHSRIMTKTKLCKKENKGI